MLNFPQPQPQSPHNAAAWPDEDPTLVRPLCFRG
jgi:hypothetical protein